MILKTIIKIRVFGLKITINNLIINSLKPSTLCIQSMMIYFHFPIRNILLMIQAGNVAKTAKGNLFKGPFHLPRQEWYCSQIIEKHLKLN